MDAELLHNILNRLDKLEQLIVDRQNTTHNRYAEILVSIEEVKTSVAEIKTESKNVDKRVSVLEEVMGADEILSYSDKYMGGSGK